MVNKIESVTAIFIFLIAHIFSLLYWNYSQICFLAERLRFLKAGFISHVELGFLVATTHY